MDNKKKIGFRIATAIAIRDVKQKDLASALGVTDNTISYFCSGTRTPKTEQIITIAKYLNVSADYLLGLSDESHSDATIQMIHSKTGLTSEAIFKLHDIFQDNDKTNFSTIMSLLIEDQNAEYFLSIIKAMFSCMGNESGNQLIEFQIENESASLYKENFLAAVFQTKIIENLSVISQRYHSLIGGENSGKH